MIVFLPNIGRCEALISRFCGIGMKYYIENYWNAVRRRTTEKIGGDGVTVSLLHRHPKTLMHVHEYTSGHRNSHW
jgi:hypothetical protein